MFNKENVDLMLSRPWSQYKSMLKLDTTQVSMMLQNDKVIDENDQRPKVYIFVPISIPGLGKSFYVENVMKEYCKAASIDLRVVSSDQIRRASMDALIKRSKGMNLQTAFEKTGKEANKQFMDTIEQKLRINIKQNMVLFIDKNHPPNAIEKTLSHLRRITPSLYKPEIIALIPKLEKIEQWCFNDMEGNDVGYPFSLNMFLKCLGRVQCRKEHETMSGNGADSLNVMLMFMNFFKNSAINPQFMKNYGFDNCFEFRVVDNPTEEKYDLPSHFLLN